MIRLLSTCFVFFIALSSFSQNAIVNKVWLEHNYTKRWKEGNVTWTSVGMMVHVNVNINGARGHNVQGVAYLYDSNKRKVMQSTASNIGNEFRTTDGQACASNYGTPDYDNSHFEDFAIFVPYYACPFSPGNHTYYILVQFIDHTTNRFISPAGEYISFTGTGESNTGGYNGGIQNNDMSCVGCGGSKKCSVCNGKGMTVSYSNQSMWHQCGACGGTGICQSCRF